MPVQDISSLKTNPPEVTVVQPPAKDLLVWKAPSRPYKKRSREYFSTIAAIVFLLVVILFFIKEWLLIAVIISLAFVSYVLATVPPEEVEYKLTTRGVFSADKHHKWEIFSRFWFTKKWDFEILNLETILPFPGRLQLILKDIQQDEVKKTVEKYLLFEKPKRTFLDKASLWLQEKVPLES